MVSVERLLEYSSLESEAAEITNVRPPADWPSKGDIEIKNLTLTYPRNQPPVLKEVSVHIKPGEKVGIVGRTGAGKSR